MSTSGIISVDQSSVESGQLVTVSVALSGGTGLTVTGVENAGLPDQAEFIEQMVKLIGASGTVGGSFGARFFTGNAQPETLTIGLYLMMSDGTVCTPSTTTVTVSPVALPGGAWPNESN